MPEPVDLKRHIRDIPDFPKPGILFRDITPLLSKPKVFRVLLDQFVHRYFDVHPSAVAGLDARGFIIGSALAYQLNVGFIPIRKKGKLPWKTRSASYQLEYGESVVEIHVDAVKKGEKVALIDDVLATGGTAAAAIKLLEECGAVVVRAEFLMELGFLAGREKLGGTPVVSLVIY